ncbi:MAG: Lrp/AsnC ligand binding domain-containing protein [Candidatus Thalassarchaeaceae archaeon]|jgi:DNA-binding Lrp family transcriptional regulator|nr:Lrp/AsnC ligand binding domain-containing protein [Candidatus Thalassarchaeaceae archaeon]DAC33332.1 MAG TPA: Lrp/AsnC family transcriptional regulator [Candidatus Poseidoniales archaeon]MDP6318547.1 Lrp/AsnC ligand binding domain-containing protein [Candidatus Thalassarchaeaceae archaeon]HIH80649.1 Lrp/AsnC family transcriptional regulator [Candidatus Thalassarchaeaceae archaeon]HJM30278.1 Lrp/AsnC ligand binding domain-containing protein [Candidatus Thalassarchaeaceae archaeon]|tara:strand:+ start:4039 stop:4272 length:234 start_codon:yes stop_codon:yes gene_type:complete
MSTAFVLIKTKPMMEAEVYRALLSIDNVVETHVVYGEYDLAARIDFSDEKEMAKVLMGEFRKIPGVEQTETLIAVEV